MVNASTTREVIGQCINNSRGDWPRHAKLPSWSPTSASSTRTRITRESEFPPADPSGSLRLPPRCAGEGGELVDGVESKGCRYLTLSKYSAHASTKQIFAAKSLIKANTQTITLITRSHRSVVSTAHKPHHPPHLPQRGVEVVVERRVRVIQLANLRCCLFVSRHHYYSRVCSCDPNTSYCAHRIPLTNSTKLILLH